MAKTEKVQTKPREKKQSTYVLSLPPGRDEMNLAEFPFATLGKRDRREALECAWSRRDKDNPEGPRQRFRWVASASSKVGLPTEFGERVLIALLALTAEQGVTSRKVTFSVYRILQILNLSFGKENYLAVRKALRQLKGVTIYSENAFWDAATQSWLTIEQGFNLIDKYRLRYRVKDTSLHEDTPESAYIVWSEVIWNSFQHHYVKELDLEFFFSLKSPLARRLYRLLDKRMKYKPPPAAFEMDIFELASRLGMARYAKPTWVKRKLLPGFKELIDRGFLGKVEFIKVTEYKRVYTRVRCIKPTQLAISAPETSAANGQASQDQSGSPQTVVKPDLGLILRDLGVEAKAAERLVSRYGRQRIQDHIELLEWNQEQKQIEIANPGAWLKTAIEKNYLKTSCPKGFQTRQQQAQTAAAEKQRLETQQRLIDERMQAQVAEQLRRDEACAKQREQAIEAYNPPQDLERIWEYQVLSQIRITADEYSFRMSLADSVLLSLQDNQALVWVADDAARQEIQGRFGLGIRRLLAKQLGVNWQDLMLTCVTPDRLDLPPNGSHPHS